MSFCPSMHCKKVFEVSRKYASEAVKFTLESQLYPIQNKSDSEDRLDRFVVQKPSLMLSLALLLVLSGLMRKNRVSLKLISRQEAGRS